MINFYIKNNHRRINGDYFKTVKLPIQRYLFYIFWTFKHSTYLPTFINAIILLRLNTLSLYYIKPQRALIQKFKKNLWKVGSVKTLQLKGQIQYYEFYVTNE